MVPRCWVEELLSVDRVIAVWWIVLVTGWFVSRFRGVVPFIGKGRLGVVRGVGRRWMTENKNHGGRWWARLLVGVMT